MSKTEPDSQARAVCSACQGSGIVIEKKVHLQIEVGRFCQNCDEGERRWLKTVTLLAEEARQSGEPILGLDRG
ncbi:MAG TPA: hypothetical protein VJX67_07705 [Blastocatellia bacterium]|nr:hypothetical protein [Blastocatellia bacterium]